MPQTTIQLRVTLVTDESRTDSIRRDAGNEFGVPVESDTPLGNVLAGIVRNTLETQFYAFGVPVEVTDVRALAEPQG